VLYSEAKALEREALSLYEAKSYEAALAAYSNLAERLSGAHEVANQRIAVRALAYRALTLDELGRSEDALAA
jgi:hypothetical protein